VYIGVRSVATGLLAGRVEVRVREDLCLILKGTASESIVPLY
jgi:hypothetical protein